MTAPLFSKTQQLFCKGIVLFFVLFLFQTGFSQVPEFVWVKDNIKGKLAVDDAGNVYKGGHFSGTVDFNPHPSFAYNLTSSGSEDIFVAKYNSSGDFLWAKRIGEINSDKLFDIHCNDAGDVWIAGEFQGIVDFDPGPGVYNLNSSLGVDGFFVKLNSTGNFVYAKQFGEFAGSAGCYSFQIDNSGNAYIAGFFKGTVDFNPAPLVAYNLISTEDSDDGFLLKLDAGGNFLWVNHFKGGDDDSQIAPLNLHLDNDGNILIAGIFKDLVDFNPSPLATYNLSSILSGAVETYDLFIVKLNNAGSFLWAGSIGSIGEEAYVYGIEIVTDDAGNVYFASSTNYYDTDVDPGPSTYYIPGLQQSYIVKLNPLGEFQSVKTFAYGFTLWTMVVDSDNRLYLTGPLTGAPDLDPGPGSYYPPIVGAAQNICVLSLDTDANLIWAYVVGGVAGDRGENICIDDDGNIYVSGEYGSTVDFDPGPSVHNLVAPSSYSDFVLKLHQSMIALPVRLISFDASCHDNNVNISWSTASETNNKNFIIERSTDGIQFLPIATIDGQGNSSDIKTYQYTYQNTNTGNTYYRLKQTDFDGKSDYSKIINLHCGDKPVEFSFFPNPVVHGAFSIMIPEDGTVSIMDTQGKLIQQQKYTAGKHTIILKQIPGVYFLQVVTKMKTTSHRLILAE